MLPSEEEGANCFEGSRIGQRCYHDMGCLKEGEKKKKPHSRIPYQREGCKGKYSLVRERGSLLEKITVPQRTKNR